MGYVTMGAAALVLLVIGVSFATSLASSTRVGEAEATIAAPPDVIVALIREVMTQPEWRRGVAQVEVVDATTWVETTTQGDVIRFEWAEVADADLALRFASTRGYHGDWRAVLEPSSGGTRVFVSERIHLEGFISKLVSYAMFRPAEFSRAYLADLKAHAEGVR